MEECPLVERDNLYPYLDIPVFGTFSEMIEYMSYIVGEGEQLSWSHVMMMKDLQNGALT